ncbi:hypothetical protein TcG_05586 [Trypanosoma cruzi]|nr:hypothetical protein TcG_05586 [Trypanosoma cruzi]
MHRQDGVVTQKVCREVQFLWAVEDVISGAIDFFFLFLFFMARIDCDPRVEEEARNVECLARGIFAETLRHQGRKKVSYALGCIPHAEHPVLQGGECHGRGGDYRPAAWCLGTHFVCF